MLRGSREFYRKARARVLVVVECAPLRLELCAQGGGHIRGGGAVVLVKRLEVGQFTKAFGE